MSEATTKPKPRRGTETRQKGYQVATRYSADEFQQVTDAASKAGLTPASFQRVQTLGTTPKTRSTRRAPIERELLARTLGQLGKIGSNLNQIAHAANMDAAERFDLGAAVAELRGLLPDLLQALGRKP